MLKKAIKHVKQLQFTKIIYKTIFKLVGMLPKDSKLVIFESYLGKQYSCNPRAIFEFLKEHHPEYKMYWSIDPHFASAFEDKDLMVVKRFTIKWLFLMARARYWVSNSRLPIWIPKPTNTIYLQTWHGTPLKRLAADMEEVHLPNMDAEKYKSEFLAESSRWDYLISPNRYSTEIFKRAFAFKKEIIEIGYPRNDVLYKGNNPEFKSSIKKKLHIPANKKVILYAPTWRDNEFDDEGVYRFNLKLNLEKMREQLGQDHVILLRLHYLISDNLNLSEYEGFVYNTSKYEDIRELYLIADLLITDYSSVFFDYANLKRQMIFFVYDIEIYRDRLRGFYFDFETEAPGPLVKTTEEVIEKIKQCEANEGKLHKNFDSFFQKFCYLEEGESSKRLVEKLF